VITTTVERRIVRAPGTDPAAAADPTAGTDPATGADPTPGAPDPVPGTEPGLGTEAGLGTQPAQGTGAGNPFAGERLFVEPNSEADRTEQEWSAEGRSAEAAEIAKIAQQPEAKWFGGSSGGNGSTQAEVGRWVGEAAAAGALPVLVAYDLPWRDCGGYSSGGASSPAAYRVFIEEMARGIGDRRAAVIVEPDALAELGCLTGEEQATYYSLLSFAVSELGANGGTAVYLDAGNATWQPAATMAERLSRADVSGARGFSLNVSNFDTTPSETSYGEAIAADLHDGSHFVIDTSRNGRGLASEEQWCNPSGRGLGAAPSAATGNPLIDAFLWIKHPGESDGPCNGGPSSGEWWPSGALELAQNAAE
jgi:endoglucanase